METFFKVVGFIIVINLVVGTMYVFGLILGVVKIPFHTVSNTIQTTHQITDKVVNADQALYNYEWFKDQENSIVKVRLQESQAKEAVDSFKAELPSDRTQWDESDKDRLQFLQTVAQGFTYELDSEMAEWNSNSSKVNRSLWKNNLPMTIDRTILTAKEALTDREGR